MGDRSKTINPKFSKVLKYLRETQNLTQAQIGKIVNKGESTVRMWELRKSEPDHQTILLLANYFGVTVDYLLGRDEKSPATKKGEADNGIENLNIPEKYNGIRVALNEGDKNLNQDDIDDIIRFINFTANKK